MQDHKPATIRVVHKITDVAPAEWDALANPTPETWNPFVSHAFLAALEEAGTTGKFRLSVA